jgi:hypothetical protein
VLGFNRVAPLAQPALRLAAVAAAGGAALFAAWTVPQLDRVLNPYAAGPGVITFLGVGSTVLALTMLLFVAGLRSLLPRKAIFIAAALSYNALLVAVKFGLGPAALYAANASTNNAGFLFLDTPVAYPGAAAIAAVLYGAGFLVIYLIQHERLQRKVGPLPGLANGAFQLFLVMFILAVVGGVTVLGLGGFLEYALSAFTGLLGVLIAGALVLAIACCSLAFNEAVNQASLTRNVAVLTTFAWIGLAFIAAYHVLWLVFLLALISIWPLRSLTLK